MTFHLFFALLAIGMMMSSRGVYFLSIWRGKTRPHAFSWFIWGVISTIGVVAQFVEGAGVGAWPRAFGAATCFVIVALALFKGEKNITRTDWITLSVALTAIPLWVLTKTPVWSVILVCAIDTIGYLPTLRKAWHRPHEETPNGYALSCLGAFFSLIAIEVYTPSTWLYPFVLTITNGSMAAFLILRKRHKNKSEAGLFLA